MNYYTEYTYDWKEWLKLAVLPRPRKTLNDRHCCSNAAISYFNLRTVLHLDFR